MSQASGDSRRRTLFSLLRFGGRKKPPVPVSSGDRPKESYFGETQTFAPGETPQAVAEEGVKKSGHQVLAEFLNHIRPDTGLAKMLANKSPIGHNAAGYRYVVNQSTEQSDLAIVLRDLTDGRLFKQGVRLIAAPWANLLFGDSFAATRHKRQAHELVYRRSTCTCIICMIKQHRANQALEASSGGSSASTATLQRISPESAMANFTIMYAMPVPSELAKIGAEIQTRDLEIGQLIRLDSRMSSKLVFTEDIRTLFCNLAYTGPMSHENMYREVTTTGVNYYLFNKGRKTRKVYLQGHLVRLPVELGVVKCGAQVMYMKEIGSTYVLYKPQVMSIYVGTIVLEGNSIGSFISTGIKFYIGFGQENGCVPVYPKGRPSGPPRRLGVNELLLHHHQVGDFEVALH